MAHPLARGFARLAIILAAGASASACRKPDLCPEGLVLDVARSTPGKASWCISPDHSLARWIEWGTGLTPRQSCNFARGRADGMYLAWHANGVTQVSGSYEAGRKQGRWSQWDANGNKVAEGDYRSGEFVGGAPTGLLARCESLTP